MTEERPICLTKHSLPATEKIYRLILTRSPTSRGKHSLWGSEASEDSLIQYIGPKPTHSQAPLLRP